MPRWNITKGKIKKIKRKRNQSEKKNSIRKYKKHSTYKNNRRNKKNKTAKNYKKQHGGDDDNTNIDNVADSKANNDIDNKVEDNSKNQINMEIPIKQYMELVASIPKFLRDVMGIKTQTEISQEKQKETYKNIGEKIKNIREKKEKISIENLIKLTDKGDHDDEKKFIDKPDAIELTGKKEKKLLDAKFWAIEPKDGNLKQEPSKIYSTIEFADDDELLELMGSVDRIQFLRSD